MFWGAMHVNGGVTDGDFKIKGTSAGRETGTGVRP